MRSGPSRGILGLRDWNEACTAAVRFSICRMALIRPATPDAPLQMADVALFEDLKVTEHSFEVGLSFKGVPEMLLIPFEAMTGFFDPSVQFSLKFEPLTEGDGETGDGPAPVSSPLAAPVARSVNVVKAMPAPLALATVSKEVGAAAPPPPDADDAHEQPKEPAKVVSIDAFRKKP